MPFFQHEETMGCVQTFFGNNPPSKRFFRITEKQYIDWLSNQSQSLPDTQQPLCGSGETPSRKSQNDIFDVEVS